MTYEQREKERIRYLRVISNSWTYQKLSTFEKSKIDELLIFCKLFGKNESQIDEQLNTIYKSFLLGLDYTPIGWREDTDTLF